MYSPVWRKHAQHRPTGEWAKVGIERGQEPPRVSTLHLRKDNYICMVDEIKLAANKKR